ncbi:MAG: VWA domain-containing protein [Alphaproteobacteria bacterium]|nr:VWA domain-containing protein [Alphaproteobacteria bacterium]
MKKRVTHFLKSTVAASAIAFALLIPVVVGGAGMAVDVATAYLVQARLSHALDAAALAGGAAQAHGEGLQEAVERFFNKNYPPEKIGATYDLSVAEVNERIEVSGRAYFNTAFMRFLGIDRLNVHASSQVTKPTRNIELAMVLDVTGSMSGSRISELRAAANDLVDIIVQDSQTPAYSKIAIVPYSMGVNVGTYATQVRGSYTNGSTCTSPGCQYYRFRNPSGDQRTLQISSCVSERSGAEAYTDAPPTDGLIGRNYASSGNPCLTNRIVPLTSNKTTLHNSINNLVAAGSTAGHIGTAWGWYMVSPNFGYLWADNESRPAPYGEEDLVKVVVLMTDGDYNTAYCRGVIAQDSGTGSGSNTDKINCNATNGSPFSQAQQLCTAMKDAGVIVYTVGFDVANLQGARDVMANCATDANHAYFADDGDELQQAFRDIARNVLSIYLSR